MQHQPRVEERDAQPYLGIRTPVTMSGLADEADSGFFELFGWLESHGVAPAGAPFIRYHAFGMEGRR